MAVGDQSLSEDRAKESGSTGDNDTHDGTFG
jgi:hypothetical protein